MTRTFLVCALSVLALLVLAHGTGSRDSPGTARRVAVDVPVGPTLDGQPGDTLRAEPPSVPAVQVLPSPRTVLLQAKDVRTSMPAAGVVFSWGLIEGDPSPDTRASSDGDGKFEVPVDTIGRLRSESRDWITLRSPTEEVLEAGRIWVCPAQEVTVRVRAEDEAEGALDLGTVSVFVVPLEGKLLGTGSEKSDPDLNCLGWLRRHGLGWNANPVHVDGRGVGQVRTAMIPGLGLKGTAAGWMAAPTPIPAPAGATNAVTVELAFHRCPRLTCRVFDAEGRPVERADVFAYARREFPTWENVKSDLAKLHLPGAALTAHSAKDGRAFVMYAFAGSLDSTGGHTLDLRSSDDVQLVVHAPGALPYRVDLGHVVSDVEHEVRLQAAVGPRVRVTLQGQPVRSTQGTLVDVTDEHRKTSVTIESDEAGAVPGSWLVVGRSYFWLFGGKNGFIKWDGRERLELGDLEPSYDRFYGYAR